MELFKLSRVPPTFGEASCASARAICFFCLLHLASATQKEASEFSPRIGIISHVCQPAYCRHHSIHTRNICVRTHLQTLNFKNATSQKFVLSLWLVVLHQMRVDWVRFKVRGRAWFSDLLGLWQQFGLNQTVSA